MHISNHLCHALLHLASKCGSEQIFNTSAHTRCCFFTNGRFFNNTSSKIASATTVLSINTYLSNFKNSTIIYNSTERISNVFMMAFKSDIFQDMHAFLAIWCRVAFAYIGFCILLSLFLLFLSPKNGTGSSYHIRLKRIHSLTGTTRPNERPSRNPGVSWYLWYF